MGRVPQGTRSPYGYEQDAALWEADIRWDALCAFPLRALAKAPYADGVVPTFFLCLRSCKHGAGCGDPVGRAERVPPTGMSGMRHFERRGG